MKNIPKRVKNALVGNMFMAEKKKKKYASDEVVEKLLEANLKKDKNLLARLHYL